MNAMNRRPFFIAGLFCLLVLAAGALPAGVRAQEVQPVIPRNERGRVDAERLGIHDANNIRTMFYNFGMVGDYPPDPGRVDLTVFHSVEVPKGTGMNYSNGITPFVLANVMQRNGRQAWIMETGFRERQGISPATNRVMRFEPRPGFLQANPGINTGRSIAMSHDRRTWPDAWPDKRNDPADPGWGGSWNGYFGKQPAADQESFFVMDDDFYDAWDFFPDSRDETRRGLGLRLEVRGFQWANPQASNVIFWHYDVTNESTTHYRDNIIFGMYMDSGVGGSALSCDGVYEADDDNAHFDRSTGMNLVYAWDKFGRGVDLRGNCSPTGYLGYAFLETPGNPFDGIDNDGDGVTDERRDSGPGIKIVGQEAIRAHVQQHYNLARFEAFYGPLEDRPAYRAGEWWTGDENMNWVAELHDTGSDGVWGTDSEGEGDGIPTAGEPNFDRTDLQESDQIGLTGFKMNRIRAGAGNPNTEVDDILFFNDGRNWPQRLYSKFTDPVEANRFDPPLAENYNIGFLFASGPFILEAGRTERFSLALAYGADFQELRRTVQVVQQIYNANYRFAVPPPAPTLSAEAGDGYVRLHWDDIATRAVDPVTYENDFEGYRIYRSTDPDFLDPRVVTNARGTGPIGHGRPIAQFDLINGIHGFSKQTIEGVAYYLGSETGIRHTWVDSTVTNGQEYYYAVTAYDHGSEEFNFFPSENPIAVSRTLRGGVVLPQNVVRVRPNPPVPGYHRASLRPESLHHTAGAGTGTVHVQILDSKEVPDAHDFRIEFATAQADSFRAQTYRLVNETTGEVLYEHGNDFAGAGTGPTGSGLLVVLQTPAAISIDPDRSRWLTGSRTDVAFDTRYAPTLPANLRRPGYPEDIIITFGEAIMDTSVAGIGVPSRPTRFRVTTASGMRLPFRFRDINGDGTLSREGEFIEVLTTDPSLPTRRVPTWRFDVTNNATTPPTTGDVYRMVLRLPFSREDVYHFSTVGEFIDQQAARSVFEEQEPYVVPNPYVAAASFEPQRFAVAGRGERRIEFRGLPQRCTVRIYTARGELVQTLVHDGSMTGMVPWDLRTKDNLEAAPGLYLFHVDAGELGTYVGKFAIIK
jgi:hypothetical protein